MKTTLGNYLTQANKDFPIDAETFDYIQQNLALLSVLGNIAGDRAILSGCEPEQNGARRKEGYVFVRTKDFPDGEILYWEGGAIASGMYLKKVGTGVCVPASLCGQVAGSGHRRRELSLGGF